LVLQKLNVTNDDISEIIGVRLGKAALEIRSDIICYLVFRLHMLPTEILIKSVLEKYAKGLTKKESIKKEALRLMGQLFNATN
jgi:hypothetical protein